MTAPVDVLAVLDAAIEAARSRLKDAQTEGTAAATAFRSSQLDGILQARAAIAELIEADKACDEAGAALRCLDRAGPRHGSYGTGWEVRDRAHRWDLERKLEAACQRRAAALARVGGAK